MKVCNRQPDDLAWRRYSNMICIPVYEARLATQVILCFVAPEILVDIKMKNIINTYHEQIL